MMLNVQPITGAISEIELSNVDNEDLMIIYVFTLTVPARWTE